MTDELISKSALFFYLLALDDKIATSAVQKVLELFQAQQRLQSKALDHNDLEVIIKLCLNHWQKIKPHLKKDRLHLISTKNIKWPEHLDLNPWKEFQKLAPENELIAVIWVHILGVPESLLARCLNTTEGTIRYRVGNGLSLLGQLNRPSINSSQFT